MLVLIPTFLSLTPLYQEENIRTDVDNPSLPTFRVNPYYMIRITETGGLSLAGFLGWGNAFIKNKQPKLRVYTHP